MGETVLVFVDLAQGKQRLGGSALAQVFKQLGADSPDVEDAAELKAFFQAVQLLKSSSTVLAYHDRSDGGLFTTLVEMAFAGRCGIEVSIPGDDAIAALFNEELGAVFQIRAKDMVSFTEAFVKFGFPTRHLHAIGKATVDQTVNIIHKS